MNNDTLYQVALTQVAGIGTQTVRTLISYCGSAKDVFITPRARLEKIPGIGPSTSLSISQSTAALKTAEDIIAKAEKQKVQILFYLDADYPNRLRHIPDAPCLLYFKGSTNFNTDKVISIVGTRNATPYGKEITQQIVADLASTNALIVSGLAYGIDIFAHKAALQQHLQTVAVMATGLDIIYPSAHQKTADHILEFGGLLTENTFGTKPDAPRFPARNRIIAGLADCTIVVEAKAKGGALITADIAHSYDREVMAVPGNINSSSSEGCNALIKTNKAAPYTNAKDLIELLNWDNAKNLSTKKRSLDLSGLQHEELAVIEVLQQTESEQIDTLSWKTQIPISRMGSLLLEMEFKGLVRSMPGKKFVLNYI